MSVYSQPAPPHLSIPSFLLLLSISASKKGRLQLQNTCGIFIFYGFFYNPPRPRVFVTLFIQYYSAICCPSDHTVGRPRAEIRTRDGRSIKFVQVSHYLGTRYSGVPAPNPHYLAALATATNILIFFKKKTSLPELLKINF